MKSERTREDVVGDTEGGGTGTEEVAIRLTRDDELDDRKRESGQVDEDGEDDHEEVGREENEGAVDLQNSSQSFVSKQVTATGEEYSTSLRWHDNDIVCRRHQSPVLLSYGATPACT